MAPELFGQISSRIYARMGANEEHIPQHENRYCEFRPQSYIEESKPNEQVGSSSRQLGTALATNPEQLS